MRKYRYMTLAASIALVGSLHAIEETTIEVSSGAKKVGFSYKGTAGFRTDKALYNPSDRRWGVTWEENDGVRITVDRTEAPPAGGFGTDDLAPAISYYAGTSGGSYNPAGWPSFGTTSLGLFELSPSSEDNVKRPMWYWNGATGAYSSNYPSLSRRERWIRAGLRPPVAMTLSFPGGVSELRVTGSFTSNWTSINTTRLNHPDNASFYWGGIMMHNVDPSGIGYNYGSDLNYRCDGSVGLPVVILTAKSGAWSVIAPENPDPVTSNAYSYTLYTAGSPAWGYGTALPTVLPIPEAARSHSFSTVVAIPKTAGKDFVGDIEVRVVGFRGQFFNLWPKGAPSGVTYPGISYQYGFAYSGFHVPTSGTVSISDPSSLTGTVTAPAGLMEGYKGGIPIQFSISK